jgi:small subunit ribosomal protein S18
MSEESINTKKLIFHFTDIEVLDKYLDDQKRILPRRITELSIKNQRKLTKAVKRARVLGLLPFVVQADY